jgi:hypothetical protein
MVVRDHLVDLRLETHVKDAILVEDHRRSCLCWMSISLPDASWVSQLSQLITAHKRFGIGTACILFRSESGGDLPLSHQDEHARATGAVDRED